MSFRQQFRITGCCAIALLAPFLGGSTERWSQGIILLLLALLVMVDPPRSSGPRGLALIALLSLCLACIAFLPASWFGIPAWRQELAGAGIPLPSMLSPQPVVSAECLVLLLAGLVWICWLGALQWLPEERSLMAGVFVCGAAALAAVSLFAFYCGKPVPFWHSERGFGPFPNRNQSGNFFAISGTLAMGCVCENFRRKKFATLLFGLAAIIICGALASSYSRAAVILFFAGAFVWIAVLGFVSESKKAAGICAVFLLAMAAAFLLFGGATLARFQGRERVTLGFRWLIYRDVFSLIHSSPWCGTGLGNFEGIFAMFRKESAMPSRIIHPESDWLWLWAETGWTGVALAIFAAGVLLKNVFPLERGTGRQLRLAAAAGALVFIGHGLVDVPGHRLGSALPGLFMLGLACVNTGAASKESRWAPACFRVAGAVCGIAGVIWIFAASRGIELPGEIGVKTITQDAQALNAAGRFSQATVETTRAIKWAPLDWKLYFIRGTAEICDGNWPRAYDDFRRLNILEATSPMVTFQEGEMWLGSRPSYAVPAWAETLRRCPPEEVLHYYDEMLVAAAPVSGLTGMLRSLARGRIPMEIIYLHHAPAEEVSTAISSILKKDPDLHSLDDAEKTAFFQLWAGNDAEGLARQFSTKPAWQPAAWMQVSDYLASHGDLRGACEAALRFMPPPKFPNVAIAGGIEELRRRLVLNGDDFLAGYGMIKGLMDQQNNTMAMQVVKGFTGAEGCPKYFHFLEAEIAFRMQDYPSAWKALQTYESAAE